MMTDAEVISAFRAALWAAFAISLPILFVALVVGTLIGLFQALTSVQEMTLTFVPKLGAIFVVFWLSIGFMAQTLTNFFDVEILGKIAGG